MLSRLLAAALLAGLLAGLVTSGLQALVTTPLILKAEAFERAEPAAPHAHGDGAAVAPHDHDEAAGWKPRDGLQRTLVTSLATIVTAVGYALLLGAAMLAAGANLDAGAPLRWAAGAFLATGLAPALGLAPELPGMGSGGDVVARQVWWLGTAAATALGLSLIAARRSALLVVAGLALLATPHLVGAPHAPPADSTVPAGLAARFAVASLAMSLLLWAAIGVGLELAWARLSGRPAPLAQGA